MQLAHLAVFHAVAQAGSVSGGAERLMVSQPAVSKQLKALERALGARLFDRVPKGVRPTEAGRVLADYARQVFALTSEASQALDALRGLRRGTLTIGASTTIGAYLLPDALVRFRAAYPGVLVRLEVANSGVIAQQLLAGAIDLGLVEGTPDAAAFEATVFYDDPLVAIAGPSHPLGRRRSVTAKALCDEPFVDREPGSGTGAIVTRALAARGLSVTRAMALGSTEAIKRVVAAGAGVAIVSRLAIGPELRAGTLVELPVSDLSIRRPLHRIRVRGRHEPKAAAAFVALLCDAREGTTRPGRRR